MRKSNEDVKIWYHTAESMPELSSKTATLAITSPPYTNRPDGKSLDKTEYLAVIKTVLAETERVLVDGGVFVMINTDLRDHGRYNAGNTRFEGLIWYKHADLRHLAEAVGLRCFDTRIWVKSFNRNRYRYNFAYIQFFQKGRRRYAESKDDQTSLLFEPHVWFLEGGTNRTMPDGTRFRDAINPELVERCIARFTRPGDLTLNPFSGSGTVLAVASLMGRRAVGYEVDAKLAPLVDQSIHGPLRGAVYSPMELRYLDESARAY